MIAHADVADDLLLPAPRAQDALGLVSVNACSRGSLTSPGASRTLPFAPVTVARISALLPLGIDDAQAS